MNKFSSEGIKTVEIGIDSEEYKKTGYQLSMYTKLPNAEFTIKSMATIPMNASAFNKDQFNEDTKQIMEAWVNRDELPEDMQLENVIANGAFDIRSEKPMRFRVGTIFDDNNIPIEDNEYTFVVGKVDVGTPYVISKEKLAENPDTPRPPRDYHTLGIDSGYEDDYKYDYYVFDKHRIKPYMVVKFIMIINENKNLNIIECEKCDENVLATVYGTNDECYLGSEGDNIVHSDTSDKFRESILQKHKRIPAEEKERTYGRCQYHPDRDLEFYGYDGLRPICVSCRVTGDHSSESQSRHSTIAIKDAYRDCLRESQIEDGSISKRKKAIITNISQINEKI